MTGLESVDQGMEDALPTLEDIPIYPPHLQTFIHPKMCIDGFPGPIRDKKNISSWLKIFKLNLFIYFRLVAFGWSINFARAGFGFERG